MYLLAVDVELVRLQGAIRPLDACLLIFESEARRLEECHLVLQSKISSLRSLRWEKSLGRKNKGPEYRALFVILL